MRASVHAMEEVAQDSGSDYRPRWRKKRYAVPGLTFLLLVALSLTAWSSRETIADDLIRQQLDAYGIPAEYQIERIGGQTQVLSNLLVGNPDAPDLTARQVIVRLEHQFGLPKIGSITLVEPRLYGTFIDGTLSFGSLDPFVFGEGSDEPGLPALELTIRDGRGLIETDYGPVGLKVEGQGRVDDGFAGVLAATAPELSFGECSAQGTTLYGKITTSSGRPRFEGPLRQDSLRCPASDVMLGGLVAELVGETDAEFADPQLRARIGTKQARVPGVDIQSLAGNIRMRFGDETATTRYSIAARGVETPHANAAVLTAEGLLRARTDLSRIDLDGDIEGNGLRPGRTFIAGVEGLAASGEGTLLEPLAKQMASALQAQTRGSALQARVRYRSDQKGYSLIVPQAELTGGTGARIASLSRVELSAKSGEAPRYSGNLAMAGPGLPRISGRMERAGAAGPVFRLSMLPYEAGGSRLAIPGMTISQGSNGALGFAGSIEASGPLQGGMVDGLSLPVSGRYDPGGALALWRDCTRVSFRRLAFSNLNIAGPGLTLCPPPGGTILRYGPNGLQLALGAPSLELAGSLAETPVRIASGPVAFAWPGTLRARDLEITLGPSDSASRFAITDLDATLGENIAGTFSDAEIDLSSVPLDIANASGDWDYTHSRFTIAGASFRLMDKEEPDRFEPLSGRDASLVLMNNLITAKAALHHPASDRLVTTVDLEHNLSSGAGYAMLDVPGLRFDDGLQPVDLTPLALGVIANAEGTVTGSGQINWSSEGEVTSTGEFTSDGVDFAAAFGPVKGASGTIRFTDLLGLTTAPGQTLQVASVNPGIEVLGGEIEFDLRDGELLSLAGGRWPFMGGQLILREVDFRLGVSEERNYVFEIVGLDAAQFVAQMELENISATGTFDGTVPIVFDADGNGRIDEGVLISRAPGGNLSYVGELTYEDLSTIANFAFEALRSMDYSQMRVVMDGPLAGEIVTRVRFDGVTQGEGAKRNLITRQIAKLPIQFRINIRAQFYQLLTSMKALYDPSAVRDPRDLGLLSDDGKRFLRRSITGEEAEPDIEPEDIIPDEPTIQDQESEDAR